MCLGPRRKDCSYQAKRLQLPGQSLVPCHFCGSSAAKVRQVSGLLGGREGLLIPRLWIAVLAPLLALQRRQWASRESCRPKKTLASIVLYPSMFYPSSSTNSRDALSPFHCHCSSYVLVRPSVTHSRYVDLVLAGIWILYWLVYHCYYQVEEHVSPWSEQTCRSGCVI